MSTELTRPVTGTPATHPAGRRTGALHRLCSAPADHFATGLWGRSPWLSRAADLPGAVDEVFSAAAVDELLGSRGLRTPFLRMAKDGVVVAHARFTGSGGVGADIADQVHDDAVLRLFADGTTVVLQGLHRTWAPVGALAGDLAAELGHPVQVNAYVTPPQSQGFAAHYDTHDVFVLQVAGAKRWRTHQPVVDDPLPDQPWEQCADQVRARAAESPLLDALLEPGDCLYLPRGYVHSAQARGDTSIHLTFGIHPVTEREVLRAVVTLLEREPGLRRRMPAGWDPAGPTADAAVDAVVGEVVARLRRLGSDRVRELLQDRAAGARRPAPLQPLAQAAAACALTRTDAVRWRRHLDARLTAPDAAGRVRLELADRRLELPAACAPALAVLLEGDELPVGALPGLEPDEQLVLARRLLREGVLVTVVPPRGP